MKSSKQRTKTNEQRGKSNGQRTKSNEQKATSKKLSLKISLMYIHWVIFAKKLFETMDNLPW